MSATTGPVRPVFRELAIDIALATGADWQTRDHFEHIRWTWSSDDRAKENLDLSVQLVNSFVELNVPAAQPSANHDAAFHPLSIAQMPKKAATLPARDENLGQLGSSRIPALPSLNLKVRRPSRHSAPCRQVGDAPQPLV
jgi:hypothetical protein